MEPKYFQGFACTITFAEQKATSFLQVIEWLKSEKKIRNVKWEQGKYIHIVNDKLVDQAGNLVQNICFNIVWEVVKSPTFKDLKPGQKFAFDTRRNFICTKLDHDYYHCPEYNVYKSVYDSEVTLI